MENHIRLSFIIPCYNSQQYLRECINSLYAQDIPEDTYQIIAVNDCSTDNTKNILLDFKNDHSNFIIIDHTQNIGQGGARNTGLLNSRGKYIWFIDHDDFIYPDILSHLIKQVEDNKLDFLQFYYNEFDESQNVSRIIKTGIGETKIISGLDFIRSMGTSFLHSYNMSIWSRIYNREFLERGKFNFDEIKIFEDLGYSLSTLIYALKIKIISEFPYCYRKSYNTTMSIFGRTIRGDYTYFSCLRSGYSIVRLGKAIEVKDTEISKMLIEGGIWRINSMTKPYLFANIKERGIFISYVKFDVNARNIYQLMTNFNKLLIKYHSLSSVVLFFCSPILRIMKRVYSIIRY